MDARSPITGANGKILVRLSHIRPDVRRRVANRVIRVEGLTGVPALELLIAAEHPRQDPVLLVDEAAARKVVER